jgi:hypothetical protein
MAGTTTGIALLAAVLAVLAAGPAAAQSSADRFMPASSGVLDPAERFEVRFGAFAHGVGSVESNSVDLNGEFVTPRLPFDVTGPWRMLVPRVHVGVNANLSGLTNVGYAGLLWTFPVLDKFFVEGFIGPSVHDGLTDSSPLDPSRAQLGCDFLFHVGGSAGYRFSDRWSVMFTFDHVSNGNSLFGTGCNKNQGLNNYGARIGYTF